MSFPTLLFGRWLTVRSNVTLFIFRTLHQPSAAKNAGCELLEASPLLIQFRERFLSAPRTTVFLCVLGIKTQFCSVTNSSGCIGSGAWEGNARKITAAVGSFEKIAA